MATPKKEKNGLYSIRFGVKKYDGSIERHYKTGFKSPREATRYELDTREEYENIIDDKKLLHNVMDEFLEVKEKIEKRGETTIASYEQYLGYIKQDIPNKPIMEVNQIDIQEAIKKNASKPRKCKWYKQLLNMLYNYAYMANYLPYDAHSKLCPLSKVIFPDYEPKQKEFGFDEEINALLNLVEKDCPSLVAPILLCAGLSLRPSEAFAITKDNITEDYVIINKAMTKVKRKDKPSYLSTHETKTKKSKRKLPISKEFYERILKFSNNFKTPYVCCNNSGEQMRLYNFETLLKRRVKMLQASNPSFPNLTPYSLRHSFGNIAKRKKVDIYTIATLMGHSNIQTTTNNYFREDDDLNKEATSKMINSLTGSKIGSKQA